MGCPKEWEAIYMCQSITQDWAWEAAKNQVQLTEQMVPDEYQQHTKVFSEKESLRFPPKHEEDMTIPLKADAPNVINCKVYLLTREERGLLEKFLAKELELGRIKEGPSPYTSLVYFINKKDLEEKCIIMDYRKVNKWTVWDNNPLPNIREALKNLRNKTLFSKFDIWWGYNNIWIAKEDQYKVAFKTKDGMFIPQVMYFRLMNMPPFFQRMMHRDFCELLQRYPENLGNYNRLSGVAADWTNVSSGTGQDKIRFAVLYWLIDVSVDDYFLLALKAVLDVILLYDWVVCIPTA